jgi:hypothetical protein
MTDEAKQEVRCDHDLLIIIGVVMIFAALIGGVFIGRASYVPDGTQPVTVAKGLTIWTVAVCVFDSAPVKLNDKVGVSPSDETHCTSLGPTSNKHIGSVIREFNKDQNAWEVQFNSPHF